MDSSAPRTLGPYEILSPLGAGGMGEVYRAKDTRLGRDVAIKILRGDVADNADLRARFEREAKTVASLNHPNIVALFEVGNADGAEYTVSELVDGESLRAFLAREGAMPVRRVVELATQMADGMSAAHTAGIVHRDLKPENVMVTRDGRIKILDFGLARVAQTAALGSASGASAETMVAPAISAPTEYMTSPGMVLGTAAYMSPEQAKGLDADYRSDQFSLGLIVYEMLAGKQAFVRGSAVETMSAIIREEPEPLDAKVPAPLRWIVDRCLEKDAGQRFDSTKDLYQQLRTLRDHFSEAFSSASLPAQVSESRPGAPGPRVSAAILVPALALALLLGAGFAWLAKPAKRNLSKYSFTPFAVDASSAVWSPDGKSAAYEGKIGADSEVFLRDLSSPSAQQLTHLHGINTPVGWSPDGIHLFLDHVDAASWSLYALSRLGGDPDKVMAIRTGNTLTWGLAALAPDAKSLAMLGANADGSLRIQISSPLGSPLKDYGTLPPSSKDIVNAPELHFTPDGHQLLFVYDAADSETFAWLLPYPAGSGTPRRVFQKAPHALGTPYFAWMPDGKHVVISTTDSPDAPKHLWTAEVGSSSFDQLTTGVMSEASPAVSPDGKSMFFEDHRNDFDVVQIALAGGEVTPLVSSSMNEVMPQYSAKTGRLVYATNRNGPEEIWLREPDGSTRPAITAKQVPGGATAFMTPSLSPDGTRVIFVVIPAKGNTQLWMASVSGGDAIPLINGTRAEYGGDWSPDGSQFAFYMPGDGYYVTRTSGGATPRLLHSEHSFYSFLPTWSPTGEWITYADDTGGIHLISPDGKQDRLLPGLNAARVPNLGFSPDGQTLYGIEWDAAKGLPIFFKMDGTTGTRTNIKTLTADDRPLSYLNPGIRFSVAPDGKSLTYSTAKRRTVLWLFQGWN
jgi:serine/threonine protein kinase